MRKSLRWRVQLAKVFGKVAVVMLLTWRADDVRDLLSLATFLFLLFRSKPTSGPWTCFWIAPGRTCISIDHDVGKYDEHCDENQSWLQWLEASLIGSHHWEPGPVYKHWAPQDQELCILGSFLRCHSGSSESDLCPRCLRTWSELPPLTRRTRALLPSMPPYV